MNTSYFSRFAKDLFLAVISVLTLSIFQNANATIYYVKTTGVATNNGLSWDSTKTFQSALDAALAGDTIWVASGVYTPSESPDGSTITTRNNAFHWNKDLKIFGGFDGTESQLEDRDFVANKTELNGGYTSFHVVVNVKTSRACVLDGFTIRDAAGTGNFSITYDSLNLSQGTGGGILNYNSEISILNCIIRNNVASAGAGIYNYQSSPYIKDVSISSNISRGGGGGILNSGASVSGNKIEILNTTIGFNTAVSGGGIINLGVKDSIILKNVLFANNQSNTNGGALYNLDSEPLILNTTFATNRAVSGLGGAVYSTTNSHATIINAIFFDNRIGSGAGNNNIRGCDIYGVLGTGSAVSKNTVQYSHLQMNSSGSYLSTTNNLITNPEGNLFQAVVSFLDQSRPSGLDGLFRTSDDGLQLTKCSDLINKGDDSSAMGLTEDLLQNSRVSLNQVDMGAYEYQAAVYTRKHHVKQDAQGNNTGENWLNAYMDLQEAIDAACPDDTIWVSAGTYVPTESPNNDTLNIRDRAFHWNQNLVILGGFSGTESQPDERDWETNETILSGNLDTSIGNCHHIMITAQLNSTSVLDGFTFQNGQADSTGQISFSGRSFPRSQAGGLYNSASSPLVANCIFKENMATQGGAVMNHAASPEFQNVRFTDNRNTSATTSQGGAMYNLVGSPILTNCVFENNSASRGGAVENTSSSAPVFKNVQFIKNSATGTSTVSGGGAMFSNGNSRPELSSVIFTENSSSTTGGAVSNIAGRLKMVNAVFSNNTATDYGGAYYSYYGTYDSISNTTFVNNSAQQGGAIYLLGLGNTNSARCFVFNSIFWGNKANSDSTALLSDFRSGQYSRFYGSYNLFQLNSSSYSTTNSNAILLASNNIHNQNPNFVSYSDPSGPDGLLPSQDDGFRLKANSPAIDAGSNSLVILNTQVDVQGSVRIQNSTVNMGAYEDTLGSCSKSSFLPSEPGIYTSTNSSQDSNFTCYCDSFGNFLLALDTLGSGAVIPADSVQLKIDSARVSVYRTAGGLITNDSGGVIFNRKWNVNPVRQPSSPVRVLYGFTNVEFTAVQDSLSALNSTISTPSDLNMYKVTNSSGFVDPHASGVTGIVLLHGATPSTSIWAYASHPNGIDHTAEYLVSNFSGGGGGGGGGGGAGPSPLPVEFIEFTAQAQKNHSSLLEWATASEENNSHFIVERSLDGIEFLEVGLVYGMGTTSSITTYQFVDIDLPIGTKQAFYRLRQVDFDGGFEYSEMRIVSFKNDFEAELHLYPNPASSQVNVLIASEERVNAGWKIANLQGQILLQGDVPGNSILQIDVSKFKPGVYLFQIKGTIHRFVVD
jgi:hypothetical protein